MLINPIAVQRLRDVLQPNYWPYRRTHYQRNEQARIFLEEAGRLLDHKSESTIKHTVELYIKGEIPYEQYMELIEEVSKEEAGRGATYGEEYARNRAFDFAQEALDHAQKQAYALSMADAKKQYELEKQKTEQSIRAVVQQSIVALETAAHQHDVDLKTTAEQQREELRLNQNDIIQQTRTEIEQTFTKHFQEERDKVEQEIREQESVRPAREAAQTAMAHIAQNERKLRRQRWFRTVFLGLGCMILILLIIILFFIPIPQWTIAVLMVVGIAIVIASYLWKSTVSEEMIVEHKRQVVLYQTKSGDYAPLSEEERAALLAQRIL